MSCEFLFTSCKVILRVANLFCEFKIKLRVPSCFLRVASWLLRVQNLRKQFYELQVVFYELKIYKVYFLSCQLLWRFKMIMFTSCEIAFYKLNIYDYNFVNYNNMVKSNFKEINLCKLSQKPILIKCNLTLDNSNTY